MIATLSGAVSALSTPSHPDLTNQVRDVVKQADALNARVQELANAAGLDKLGQTRLDLFHAYMGVFVVAFLVTLFTTPVMRWLAVANGIIDRPDAARKVHRAPVAYLGGVAVYLGILAAIFFVYTTDWHHLIEFHSSKYSETVSPGADMHLPGGVPISVLLGMTVIMLCGLLDDVVKIFPRAKIAGMLFAAAALAYEDIGVKVAAGVILPLAKSIGAHLTMVNGSETILIPIPGLSSGVDIVYWTGTAIIAIFVLGACNASNLIDGLDGLLSGTTAISAFGLLLISLNLALADDGPRDTARLILCMALLGGCLGFLPHNFNPATIFLGDTGSLLLGFCTIVVVLSLGDTGKTHLVVAGLVVYALPIIDTTLAIVRRRVAGRRISDPDDNHLHHMLKRALGVKGAVLVLYGISAGFAAFGVALSEGRGRVTYALVLVFAAFIAITAFKIARKEQIEQALKKAEEDRERRMRITPATAQASKPASPSGPGIGASA